MDMAKHAIGAEALIIRNGNEVVKRRVKKGYRIAELDERIRKRRTALESRLLSRAIAAGVKCPRVMEAGDYEITLEHIRGPLVRTLIETGKAGSAVFVSIGAAISRLHSADIIHGDLTTSNMIWSKDGLYLIDFGLGRISHKVEDKAMDLYLFSQVMASAGNKAADGWKSLLKAYQQSYSHAPSVVEQLKKIGKRRRYK